MIICTLNPISKTNVTDKNTKQVNEIKQLKLKQSTQKKSYMETQTRVRSKILSIANKCYDNPETDLCCNYWLYLNNVEETLDIFDKKKEKSIDFEKIKNEEQRWDVI